MMKIFEKREQWTEAYRQGWLAKLKETGQKDWRIYARPENKHAPGVPGVNLSESRLMYISSAGGFLRGDQEPFDSADPLGDYTVRTFSPTTSFPALDFAHDHYDHAMRKDDPQVVLPLEHLRGLVAAGRIGSLTPSVVSFMGYQPDAGRTVDELVPRVLAIAKEDRADAALLAPV